MNNEEKEEKEKSLSERTIEDIIVRRFFALTHLHTVKEASYRTELNPDRKSECVTTADYTRYDYNYVTLKRKNKELLLAAIDEQPGARLGYEVIERTLLRWMQCTHIPLVSYVLDTERARLVKAEDKEETRRPLVIMDLCPKTQHFRFSLLISFMKVRVPDLMGHSRIEELIFEPPKVSPHTCIACYAKTSDCVMMPCNHVVLCYDCSEMLQPQECLFCQKEVVKYERVFYATQ